MSGRPSTTAARRVTAAERSRIGRLRASHSYGLVLGLVIASFLFTLLAPDDSWTGSVLVFMQSVTLVVALWTSGISRSWRRLFLLAFGIAAAIANIYPGGHTAAGIVLLCAGVLTLSVATVIAVGVVDQGEANVNSVRGAIAIYVLLGLLFVFTYGAIAALGHTPFFANGTDGTRALRTYFSYVTLATLGYGDYTPGTTLGHGLAVVEALLGQLYLVTVVAVLVSRLSHRGASGNGDRPLIPPG
jgi:hypothetical protein